MHIKCKKSKIIYFAELPEAPTDIHTNLVSDNVTLIWSPGFSGYSDLSICTIQVL